MPRIQIDLGPYSFPTKRDAELHLKQLLRTAPRDAPLHPDDEAMLRDLVARHPDAAEKIGSGIRAITVRVFEYGSPCFWIHHDDGPGTDFSYRRALSAPSRRADVMAAMRALVEPQIQEFLDGAAFPVRCRYSGALLHRGEGEVHHAGPHPFAVLVERFLSRNGLSFDDVALVSAPAAAGRALADRVLAADWCDYHRAYARLCYVHPDVNRRAS